MKAFTAIGLVLTFACAYSSADERQNVIFILADDLGYHDLSSHGSNQILTPNIDALFYSGVTLDRYYTSPLCSPTRSALMTGRYAHHIGMHHEVTWPQQPWGLGMDQKTIAQFFKEAGYNTHMIGKWHLGLHQRQYWPHHRGFDTAFGAMAGPYVDYWTRTYEVPQDNFPGNNYTIGYDWRLNDEVVREVDGEYITDVITNRAVKLIKESTDEPFFIYVAQVAMHRANSYDPLPYKQSDYEQFSHIADINRRKYACMLKSVDDSVGAIVKALDEEKKLDNTVIVFTSDNGGPTVLPIAHNNSANNFPLRGIKGLAWEGGIRVPAAIFSSSLPSGVKRSRKFHVSDWLPTLNTVSGANFQIDRFLDGIDQTTMLKQNEGPFRMEVETIDQYYYTSSFIRNQWKLVNSTYQPTKGTIDTWFGTNNNADHLADEYIDIVLDSPAGRAFRTRRNPLNKPKVRNVRANMQFECTNPIVTCEIMKRPCLYNIDADPCERTNLADNPDYAEVLQDMLQKFSERLALATPRRNLPGDYRSDPSHFGGVWNSWEDDSIEGPSSFGEYAWVNTTPLE